MSHDHQHPCSICSSKPVQANMDYFSHASPAAPASSQFVICEKCIRLLYNALSTVKKAERGSSELEEIEGKSSLPNLLPKDIFNHLEEYIIGQQDTKRAVAVAVYQHYQRIRNPELKRKSNIMIMGPTGSGKTEIARSIATLLNVPFAHVDVTTMTPRGYIGDSPEVCVEKLLMAAGGNVQEAEKGIIFLDEFDKIPSGVEYGSFKAKAVQQEILKIVEGDKVDVKVGGDQNAQKVTIDTSKILFIAAGSFAGIEKFIEADVPQRVMGISATFEPKKDLSNVRPDLKHFVSFGFIPEILGRFPVVCFTNELSEEDLCRVLTEPKGSVIEHYQSLFKTADAELEVTPACLKELAKRAILEKLGARGLAKQLEVRLQSLMFSIDQFTGKRVVVDIGDYRTEEIQVKEEQEEATV